MSTKTWSVGIFTVPEVMSTSVCWNETRNHLSLPEFLSICLVPLLWKKSSYFLLFIIYRPHGISQTRNFHLRISFLQVRVNLWSSRAPWSKRNKVEKGDVFGAPLATYRWIRRRKLLEVLVKPWGSGKFNQSQHTSDDVMKEIHVEWLIWCLICVLSVSLPYLNMF